MSLILREAFEESGELDKWDEPTHEVSRELLYKCDCGQGRFHLMDDHDFEMFEMLRREL